MTMNYYDILSINRDATLEEIQKAYKEKSFQFHPDFNKGISDDSMFRIIKEAYETLSDPERRSKYDNDLNFYRQNVFNSINSKGSNKVDIKEQESLNKQDNKCGRERERGKYNTKLNKKSKRILQVFICLSFITACIIYHTNNPNNETLTVDTTKSNTHKESNNTNSDLYSDLYKNNHLMNGDSPFTEYFGLNSYDDSQENYITVKNGSDQDAIVILKNITSKKIIRNVYINKHTSYDIKNIPEGIYEMKCVYGNEWNPNLLFDGMKLGMFQSNVYYSSQANYKDYFNMFSERTKNGISIPYYEVTLHKVSNGNMRTKKINQSDFFEK